MTALADWHDITHLLADTPLALSNGDLVIFLAPNDTAGWERWTVCALDDDGLPTNKTIYAGPSFADAVLAISERV